MNVLVLDLLNYNSQYLYFLDTQKNLLLDGYFTKVIYTHMNFTMNGLYFHFPIQHSYIENCKDKYYIHFDINSVQNASILQSIFKLETQILLHYANFTTHRKSSNMTLYKHLQKGKFRIFEKPPSSLDNYRFILKISGIWETNEEFGITYKWLEAKPLI
jgi:hypothetical protein